MDCSALSTQLSKHAEDLLMPVVRVTWLDDKTAEDMLYPSSRDRQ